MKKFIVTMLFASALGAAAMAEDAVQAANSVCSDTTCLTGLGGSALQYLAYLVLAATFAAKMVSKDSFVGKIINRIANLQIKK